MLSSAPGCPGQGGPHPGTADPLRGPGEGSTCAEDRKTSTCTRGHPSSPAGNTPRAAPRTREPHGPQRGASSCTAREVCSLREQQVRNPGLTGPWGGGVKAASAGTPGISSRAGVRPGPGSCHAWVPGCPAALTAAIKPGKSGQASERVSCPCPRQALGFAGNAP